MLSQTAEYALRAIVHLSDQPNRVVAGTDLARATRVPANYLSKVMQSLARAGLIHAQRGKGGGFRLAKSPDQIAILQVITAVDPIRRIRHCPLGLRGHELLCPLHQRLDQALAQVEKVFGETRISELLQGGAAKPLCELVELTHA